MEATKTSNETVIESAKMSEKWLTEISEAMMSVYNKQLQFSTEIYENFSNMLFGNTKGWGERKNFSDMFLNSDLAKWPGTSFTETSGNSNVFMASFDKIYKQTLEYNRNFLASLNSAMKNNQVDWSKTNAEYLKTMEMQFEISKKTIVSLSETSNRQLDLSIEANKQLMERLNVQLNSLMKQNQKLWGDFESTQHEPANGEDNKNKESNKTETKKKWNVPVVE